MTKAEKSWAKLVEQETAQAKYKIGDIVQSMDSGDIFEITAVVMGVFGGCEYKIQSIDSTKRGIGFESKLIKVTV